MGHSDQDGLIQQEAERILNSGIRNLWYPVAPSWQVQNAPIGITRLGDRIVLWRAADGQVNALEDRCPHRRARLSLGWNLSDRVACWYHGVEVEGSGTVRKVPASAHCPMEGQKRVRSYPVRERAGAIFLWFGADAKAEPAPLQLPEELTSDDYSHFLCVSNWKVNYRYAIDCSTLADQTP
jgi:phenylpropionate dioxygenase-like ring-hydroxylating dioxygenase large terminal subunit